MYSARSRWFRWLAPLVLTLATLTIVHLCHCGAVLVWLSDPRYFAVGVLAVWALELAGTCWMFGVRPGWAGLRQLPRFELLALAARLVFWGVVFQFWVLFLGATAQELPFLWLKFVGPRVDVNISLVYWGMGWMTDLLAVVVVVFYGLTTARTGRLRLVSTVLVPMALSFVLFQHLYQRGGLPSFVSQEAIEAQPGVSIVYQSPEMQEHPRDICLDDGVLFLSYGCTFCPVEEKVPNLIRVDLQTDEVRELIVGPVREFSCPVGAEHLAIAPWHSESVHLVDKAELTIARSIPSGFRRYITIWEPMSLLYDPDREVVHVTNDVEPALMVFSTATGELLDVENLWEDGHITLYGTPAQSPRRDLSGDRLFFTAGPGDNLYEYDVDSASITRILALDDIAGTGLLISEATDRIWYQSSVNDALFEIALDDFEVVHAHDGRRFSRGLRLDPERGWIYLLNYFGGELLVYDPEAREYLGSIEVGGRPNAMVLVDDHLWIHSMAGAIDVDLEVAIEGL